MRLIHTGAILSRETEKALFYLPRPRSEKLGGEARQVKQSYSDILGQNGPFVTKAHAQPLLFGSRGLFVFDTSPKCVDREGLERQGRGRHSVLSTPVITNTSTSPGFFLETFALEGLTQHTLCIHAYQFVYVVVQFYPWFKFYFLLFPTHYCTLPYPKTKDTTI